MRRTFINDTVIQRFVRSHEEVAIAVLLNLLHRLVGVIGNVLVDQGLGKEDFLGLNFNVRGLSLRTTERLVDHDAGIGERLALAGGARPQQKGPHAGRHAKADRLHVARNELYGVKYGETGTDAATRAVNVKRNVFVRIFVGQVQQLGDKDVCDFIIDFCPEQEDAIFQQSANDVQLLPSDAIDSGQRWWTRRSRSRLSGFIGLVGLYIVMYAEMVQARGPSKERIDAPDRDGNEVRQTKLVSSNNSISVLTSIESESIKQLATKYQ